ncbi:hypothetical protein Q5752_005876 [Cryptotrichosporon argae]
MPAFFCALASANVTLLAHFLADAVAQYQDDEPRALEDALVLIFCDLAFVLPPEPGVVTGCIVIHFDEDGPARVRPFLVGTSALKSASPGVPFDDDPDDLGGVISFHLDGAPSPPPPAAAYPTPNRMRWGRTMFVRDRDPHDAVRDGDADAAVDDTADANGPQRELGNHHADDDSDRQNSTSAVSKDL